MEVTALVPCYNEEKTIGNVLKVLTTSPELDKVIVVNDCSTDHSVAVIKQFQVQLISNRKNLGKGESVKKALRYVNTKFIMLCDADLSGLRHDHITTLLKPLRHNPNLMTVGLRDKGWHFSNKLIKHNLMILLLSGERAIRTKCLKCACADPRSAKFGLEVVINFYCRRNGVRIVKVDLAGVRDISKLHKHGKSLLPWVKETINIADTYTRLYLEDAAGTAEKLKNEQRIRRVR